MTSQCPGVLRRCATGYEVEGERLHFRRAIIRFVGTRFRGVHFRHAQLHFDGDVSRVVVAKSEEAWPKVCGRMTWQGWD
jgi:hypothetical protein